MKSPLVTRPSNYVLAALVLAATFASRPAHAKDVVVRQTWDIPKPSADLIQAIAAYDQYCARGCRYHVPSVTVAQILPYARHADDFYTWTAVKDIKDSSWFSHCVIVRRDRGARIEVRMVPPATAESLQKATRREHDPSVDASSNVYDLREIDVDGKPATRITLTETVTLSGVSALVGSGIVRDRLEEAARAMHDNLSRPSPTTK